MTKGVIVFVQVVSYSLNAYNNCFELFTDFIKLAQFGTKLPSVEVATYFNVCLKLTIALNQFGTLIACIERNTAMNNLNSNSNIL